MKPNLTDLVPERYQTPLDTLMRKLQNVKLFRPLISLFYRYHEIILYLIFGALTTLLDFLVYFPLANLLSVHYLIANLVSWIVAVIFAYVTNRIFVFESTSSAPKDIIVEFLAFIGGRVFSFLVQELLLFIMVDLMHRSANLSKIIVAIVVIILNYIISKLLVFRKK